jgi:hypothetical protein
MVHGESDVPKTNVPGNALGYHIFPGEAMRIFRSLNNAPYRRPSGVFRIGAFFVPYERDV